MVALGPGIGFVLGSYFGSKWININDEIDSFDLNKNDPRWIGRWWAGFLISSTLLFLLSIILFTFPSSLSNHSQLQQTTQNESSTNFQGHNFSFPLFHIKNNFFSFSFSYECHWIIEKCHIHLHFIDQCNWKCIENLFLSSKKRNIS